MDMWTGKRFDTDESIVVRVGEMEDDLIDALTREANEVVPDIGVSADLDANTWAAVMPASEFLTWPTSLEEPLLYFWTAFSCWPIAVLGCRALQAWMPSYHEC